MSAPDIFCQSCHVYKESEAARQEVAGYTSEISSLELDIASCGLKDIIHGKRRLLYNELVKVQHAAAQAEQEILPTSQCPGPREYTVEHIGAVSMAKLWCGLKPERFTILTEET